MHSQNSASETVFLAVDRDIRGLPPHFFEAGQRNNATICLTIMKTLAALGI